MSRKRDRPERFQIDEKTLEYKDGPKQSSKQKQSKMIGQRKIHKIKKIEQNLLQIGNFGVNFITFGHQSQKVPSQQVDQKQKSKDCVQQDINKNNQQKQEIKKNLVEDDEQQQIQKQKVTELNEAKNQDPRSPSFNSSNRSVMTHFGLFKVDTANMDFKQKAKEKLPFRQQKDLFSFSTDRMFSILNSSQSIFGSSLAKKQTKGLINDPEKGKQKQQQHGNQQNQEQQQGESSQLNEDQNIAIDPSKSTGKYKYQQNCKILFKQPALKIKKQNGDVVNDILIIIQQDPQNKALWFMVKMEATKISIINALLVKGKSEVKSFGNKPENVVVSVLNLKKQSSEKIIVKIQFKSKEIGQKFIQLVQQLTKQQI